MKTATGRSKQIDEKIAAAPEFARPVLRHLRDLVHGAVPDVTEEIKWSRPFFLHRGRPLCYIAAFTRHCGFGFWGPEMGQRMRAAGMPVEDASGSLGRITSLQDLPPDDQLIAWIREAAALAEQPSPTPARKAPAKPRAAPEVPPELAAALAKNKAAAKVFADFSPSCRREYVDWIVEARRTETRDKRVAQAIDWIAEGKQRNWKYQNC